MTLIEHPYDSDEFLLTKVGLCSNGDRYITNMFSAKEKPESDGNIIIATQRGVTVVNDIKDEEELGINYYSLFEKDDIFCKHRLFKVSETIIISIQHWGFGERIGGVMKTF